MDIEFVNGSKITTINNIGETTRGKGVYYNMEEIKDGKITLHYEDGDLDIRHEFEDKGLDITIEYIYNFLRAISYCDVTIDKFIDTYGEIERNEEE